MLIPIAQICLVLLCLLQFPSGSAFSAPNKLRLSQARPHSPVVAQRHRRAPFALSSEAASGKAWTKLESAEPKPLVSFQGQVQQALDKMADQASAGHLTPFIREMKSLAARTNMHPIRLADHLVDMVEAMEPAVLAGHLQDWLWSLGNLGFSIANSRHRAIIESSVSKLCSSRGLTAKEMTSCLTGLQLTGWRLSNLPADRRRTLWDVLESVVDGMTCREFSVSLQTLSKLGVKWVTLPVTTSNALWQHFQTISNTIHTRNAATVLYAFSVMGLSVLQMDEQGVALICSLLSHGCSPCPTDSHQSARSVCQSNSLSVLGALRMGLRDKDIPAPITAWVQSCLAGAVSNAALRDIEFQNTCMGVSGIWSWDQVSPALQTALLDTAFRRLPHLNGQDFCTILNALSASHLRWADLSFRFQQMVQAFAMGLMQPNQSLHVTMAVLMVVEALGALKADWSGFSDAFHAIVLGSLLQSNRLDKVELTDLLRGLSRMGVQFNVLNNDQQAALLNSIAAAVKTVHQEGLLRILNNLVVMRADWASFPVSVQVQLLETFAGFHMYSSATLSGILLAFGKLGVKFSDLPDSVVEMLQHELNEQQGLIGQALHDAVVGIRLMEVDWLALKETARQSLVLSMQAPNAFQDAQQLHGVLEALADMGAQWHQLPGPALEAALAVFPPTDAVGEALIAMGRLNIEQ